MQNVQNKIKQLSKLKTFLLAFFVYSMGVQTVMLVATYFGEQEIRWKDAEERTIGLIVSILIIQLVAALGAKLTAFAARLKGNIATLIILNLIWVAICIIAYFIYEPIHFYFTAVLVGLVMGGIQTMSRSTYSRYLPETKDTTSFFSFFDVSEKIGIVIGMVTYGAIDQFTGSMRNSAVFLVVFFLIGIYILWKVYRLERKQT